MSKTALHSPKLVLFLLSLFSSWFPILILSQHYSISEQAILLKIKQQWGNQTPIHSWSSTTSPCHWAGIDCNDGKSVSAISLNSHNIEGKIPPSICDLKNLTLLDLANNNIGGKFPTLLYKCSRLQKLNLSSNNFVGQLPNDINKLSPNLQNLDLGGNSFSGDIPSSIAKIKGLITLRLDSNLFDGTFPSKLANLKTLEELVLAYNPFYPVHIPKEFGMLKSLKFLGMSRSGLIGEIPNEFASLASLEHLDLAWNFLEGKLPSGLFLLKNLTHLYLNNNMLTGEISSSIAAHNLVEINLSMNKFNGTIPEGIGNLQGLEVLDLSDNQLHGALSPSIGLISSLKILRLSKNQLSGHFPPEIGLNSNLKDVNVANNRFTGKLLEHLCSQVSASSANLLWLDISNNKFSGPIPSNVSNLEYLLEFKASNNQFRGKVPMDLTAMSSLSAFLLDGNQLSGELPSRIISWESLFTLNLARNNLSGTLPAALGSLPNLANLDLSNNNLSGQIPLGLAHISALNLSSNNLIGNIPREFDSSDFNHSFLGNANLCSDKHISNLHRCSSSRNRYLVVILVPGAIIFLMLVCFAFFKINMGRHEEKSCEKLSWELKPFHRVDFTETMIVSGLTDNNMIGSGGSGKVYRIILNDSGDKVAVKRIWNGRKLEDALEKQFLTEVEILGTIRHANIVKLLCCVLNTNVKLLVYEYMENHSLDNWLNRKRRKIEPSSMHSKAILSSPDDKMVLDWPTRLKIAVGAAKGLCYLHNDCSPPIIHRDVKSSNILLDSDFNAKIADFGLAKTTVNTEEPQTASVVAGSFGYIAPEYWHTKRLDEKIDVYSFGVVLLELATGKSPCKGNDHLNLAEWSWQHCCEENPIIDALDEDIKESRFMEQMVRVFKLGLICTSKMPRSRPSMKQVLQLLNACSHSEIYGHTQIAIQE